MKAVLELEAIADDLYELQRMMRSGKVRSSYLSPSLELDLLRYGNKSLKPWVAKVTISAGRLEREFVRYQMKDYFRANSTGSRGVYLYYVLSDGLYEVNERVSKVRARRHFIYVKGDKIMDVATDEVLRWVVKSG